MTASHPGGAPFGNRWAHLSLVAAVLVPAFFSLGTGASGAVSAWTRVESFLLWSACLLPAWSYLSMPAAERPPLPFFPLFGVVFGAYFALPLVLGLTDLGGFGSYLRPEDYAAAADAAVFGWAGIVAGRALTRRLVPEREARPGPPLNVRALMGWAKGLALGGAAFALLIDSVVLPTVIVSAVAFVFMLGRFGLALGLVLVAQGHARRGDALVLAAAAAAMGFTILISGSLSGFLFLAATIGFALWAGRGALRLREVVVVAVLLTVVVSLKAVLPDFRDEAWMGSRRLSPGERVVLMRTLVQERIEQGDDGSILSEGSDRFAERSAAADLLADVIQRTPTDVPYWRGGSYVSLVGALVPRVLWPDKPQKDLGQRFGHRYGYLGVDNTTTSINFPWLVEFYANFGMGFMPVGGALLGAILAVLGRFLNRPGQGVMTTAAGIALLVPLYNIESDFSLIYGGLVLYGLALSAAVWWIGRSAIPRWGPLAGPDLPLSYAAAGRHR